MNGTGTAKSAKKIMFAVMGSRILGLVREMILTAIFGATKELDAFYTAFRIPNLLRDLFAEGALSVSFVTTFSKKMETEGKASAFRLASLVISSLCIVIGLGSFGLPASASTAFNAVSIVCGLAIGWLIDPNLGWKAIYGFSIGTVLGGMVQLFIQIPRSIKLGFHYKWMLDWKDSGLKQVIILTLPSIIGGAAVH